MQGSYRLQVANYKLESRDVVRASDPNPKEIEIASTFYPMIGGLLERREW